MNILSFKLSIYSITCRTSVSKARQYCPITQWVERSNMNIKSVLSLHMKGEHDVAKYSSLCAKGYFVNNYRKLNLYEV